MRHRQRQVRCRTEQFSCAQDSHTNHSFLPLLSFLETGCHGQGNREKKGKQQATCWEPTCWLISASRDRVLGFKQKDVES